MTESAANEPQGGAVELTAEEPTTRKRSRFRFPHSWREVKQMGWKMVAAFVLFYLIRDTLMYIVVPYVLVRHILPWMFTQGWHPF